AEGAARTAAAGAAAAEDRMRQLLADVSHELRTPVAGLQATAETLLRDNPARPQREQLMVGMIQQTHRAGRLVADLLLMTRLDQAAGAGADAVAGAGAASGQRMLRQVNLTELATRIVAEQRLLAPECSLDLTASGAVWVHGDAERLSQVLTNLLDNARHAAGPGGGIRVDVVGTNVAGANVAGAYLDGAYLDGTNAAGAAEACLSVTDSGPGVAPADRERIFERFVRLDESRASNRGGSGLGLPIARALVRAHAGTLTCVARRPGETPTGARFELVLPRVVAPEYG
ncbi:HAMP domain-containing histidine kinase, partial [Cryobacterium frigoriphilum]